MCPSKSKWCSRFFCVFRGPVSVKKGTIRKTYFITSPTLPPFSQSWCEDFWQSQAEWKKVPSLQYWMCQFRESTLTEWGKGSGSYEICFSDGTFFHRYRNKKSCSQFQSNILRSTIAKSMFFKRTESSKTIPGGTFGSQRLLGTVFLGLGSFSAYRRNVRNLEEPFVLSVY